MERLVFDDVELTYDVTNGAERVVLVHASAFVSWYDPLIEQLTEFSTLRYRRRLRESAGGGYRPLTVAEDAATCARLMDHVGWSTAHLVGHSYGALVALQLALDAPERVDSVALLEPAARGISSTEQVVAALQPVIDCLPLRRHRRGGGPLPPSRVRRRLPGGAGPACSRTRSARRSPRPTCSSRRRCPRCRTGALGRARPSASPSPCSTCSEPESAPRFAEAAELVQSWFPDAERLTVPDAGHLLMVQNPTALARGLTSFVARARVS